MDRSNQKIYENFLEHCRAGSVFQMYGFGKFQEKIPYRGKSWALVTKNEKGNVTATCLVIKIKMRFGQSRLWVPYGPLVDETLQAGEKKSTLTEIFNDIARIAREERAIFARIEPAATAQAAQPETCPTGNTKLTDLKPTPATNSRPGAVFDQLDKKWRTQQSPSRFTPEHSLILDLTKSEEEILAQMKPKGRYNIQVAKKHGVIVMQCDLQSMILCQNSVPGNTNPTQNGATDKQTIINMGEGEGGLRHTAPNKTPSAIPLHKTPFGALDKFYKILQSTGTRDGFGIHPKFFYETLLQTFGPENSKLFLAYAPGKKNISNTPAKKTKDIKLVAGIIVIYYKDTATYYFGASDREHGNLMAPYSLQWEAIREAKKRGMKFYDFLGIAPAGSAKEKEWSGVTEFKKKFGGREISYPPAFDIIYRPILYGVLKVMRKI